MSSGQRPYEIRVRISPKFMSGTLDSGVIGDRIDVYEDRVSGVEGWAQYRYGEDSRGQSRELFMRAVKDVFPVVERHVPDRGDDLATELAMLYDEARCGAFHDGMTRRSILLQQTGAPISISAQRATPEISAFVIDPAAFVDDIEYHFERYVAALRDPKNADLRDNFTRTWERKHAGGPLHVPLGFPPGFGPSSGLGLG